MGAIAALKQAGRTDVKTYSINGSPQALKAVKNGTMTQIIWQDGYTEGKDLFDGGLRLDQGRQVLAAQDDRRPRRRWSTRTRCASS